jgi:hypothetical protein
MALISEIESIGYNDNGQLSNTDMEDYLKMIKPEDIDFYSSNIDNIKSLILIHNITKSTESIKTIESSKDISPKDIVTIFNPGTNNTCMYLSLRQILIGSGIVDDISVRELRTIGGLDPEPDGMMWDSDIEADRDALQSICNLFNINVQIHTRFGNNSVQGYFFKSGNSHKLHALDVHINHRGIHFTAISKINYKNGQTYMLERLQPKRQAEELLQPKRQAEERWQAAEERWQSEERWQAKGQVKGQAEEAEEQWQPKGRVKGQAITQKEEDAMLEKAISLSLEEANSRRISKDLLERISTITQRNLKLPLPEPIRQNADIEDRIDMSTEFVKEYYRKLSYNDRLTSKETAYHNLLELYFYLRSELIKTQNEYNNEITRYRSLMKCTSVSDIDMIRTLELDISILTKKLSDFEKKSKGEINQLLIRINIMNKD